MRLPRFGPKTALICTLLAHGAAGKAAAQARYIIIDEPRGSAVGVAVVISAGTAWELRPETGLSYLAARSVVEDVRPVLEPLGGQLAAECDRSGTRITLALPAASWEMGAGLLFEALFERPPSDGAVERARRLILRELHLAEGSDAAEIRAALARAGHGATDRWARPACGTTETIGRLPASSVRRLAQTRFTPYRTVAAVVGPVGESRPRTLLSRYLPESDLPVLLPTPTRSRSGTDRMSRVERNTVTAWVGISFEFGDEIDPETVRMLGFILAQRVAPAPTRPEIYDATVEVVQHGGGGALVVYLVTAPPQAQRWVEEVHSIVANAADQELPEPVFKALRHRYTGQRLLRLETPEARARDAALQLFFEQTFRPPLQRIEALTPAALQRAAANLAPPAVALLGPR